jgi:prenyltransferase beta subunit
MEYISNVKAYINDVLNRVVITNSNVDDVFLRNMMFIVGICKIVDIDINKEKIMNVMKWYVVVKDNIFIGFKGNVRSDNEDVVSTFIGLAVLKMMNVHIKEFICMYMNNESVVYDEDVFIKEVCAYGKGLNGEFRNYKMDEYSEIDIRFTYCALGCLRLIRNDNDAIMKYLNTNEIVNCILKHINAYECGWSLTQHGETNCGLTYCAIASLMLLNYNISSNKQIYVKLVTYLINRITTITGRTNKQSDSCYSFWVSASLHLLNVSHLINEQLLTTFISQCNTIFGGFSKHASSTSPNIHYPDIMHTYFTLNTLLLINKIPNMKCNVNCILCVPLDK